MDAINVLSLFDGISCGQYALELAGIPVKNYYASEIAQLDKNSQDLAYTYGVINEINKLVNLFF